MSAMGSNEFVPASRRRRVAGEFQARRLVLRWTAVAFTCLTAFALGSPPRAAAQTSNAGGGGNRPRPVVHPIYAHVADAPQNDLAVQRFSAATRRFGLGPVEIVDIEGDQPPVTAPKLRAGIELIRKLQFGPGRDQLDQAASEVAATGGAGLDVEALSDLFVFRAWAVGQFDFNREHVPALTARAEAYGELLRAALLTPTRQFNPQQFPPLLLEDWVRAVAEVAARLQTTLRVHAAPEATVTCDGGKPIPGPATFVGLAQGEHFIHIDEPGWAAWGATVSLNGPAVEVQVPARRALSLDDVNAAARARRMGATFALVAEPRPGRDGGLWLGMRLVDAAGARHDAVVQPLAGDPGALDAAVMRLDEQARRIDRGGSADPSSTSTSPTTSTSPGAALPEADLLALPPPVLVSPPPGRASLGEHPGAWARDHWPLLTAVGAMLGTALVLSLTLSH